MSESVFDERQQQATPPRHVRPRSSRRRKHCVLCEKPWLAVILVAVLAVLLVLSLVLGLRGCSAKPSIEGRWNLDGATVYEFYPEGKGALVLTTMSFEFDYTINKDVISIDFADDRATDAKYEYVIDGDLLMLTGGPGEAQTQHVLKREG